MSGPTRPNQRPDRAAITADEHAGFDRPRRRTRPRTKDRPNYSQLPLARITAVDRGRYRCLLEADEERLVSATKARLLRDLQLIVGDQVRLDGDITGLAGSLARVVEVLPRRTVLRRTADDDDPLERPIVANADQLLIITALADPPPRTGMIDRIMVAAYDAGVAPVLCLTKADLASPGPLIAAYRPLQVPVLSLTPNGDLDELRGLLAGQVSVFVGHSGVGKSTLVNRLIPDANRVIGQVNQVTGRGRHTSTSAVALRLPGAGAPGWVIDTPGVRSFGLSHVTSNSLVAAFRDLAQVVPDCPRGCTHAASAPECALDPAVQAGLLQARRVESFRRILQARLASG